MTNIITNLKRIKLRTYTKLYTSQYFWRTWKQSEVDLVEEREGKLFGYELKWKEKAITPPKEWNETYGVDATWEVVHPNNALQFLGIE